MTKRLKSLLYFLKLRVKSKLDNKLNWREYLLLWEESRGISRGERKATNWIGGSTCYWWEESCGISRGERKVDRPPQLPQSNKMECVIYGWLDLFFILLSSLSIGNHIYDVPFKVMNSSCSTLLLILSDPFITSKIAMKHI